MKKNNKLDVWMISRVSAFLNESISTTQGNLVDWIMNDGSEVLIDFDKEEIRMIDWVGDDKTYYAIVGVAHMADFKIDDYFTDK
jgi:hypothetical protein